MPRRAGPRRVTPAVASGARRSRVAPAAPSASGRLRLNYYQRADGSDRTAARERDLRTVIAKLERMGFSVASAVVVSLAVTMSFAWFLASPGQAHACKCAVPGTPAEELEKFSAVFAGRVVSVRHSYDLNAASYTPDDCTTVGFEVSTVWKGTVYQDMSITTPPTGGSCGFTFAEGEEFVVYADDSAYGDDGYTVGICSRTALLRQAQADIDALGEGRAPQAGSGGPVPDQPQNSGVGWAWIIIPIVAATVLVVGGMVAYRRVRSR